MELEVQCKCMYDPNKCWFYISKTYCFLFLVDFKLLCTIKICRFEIIDGVKYVYCIKHVYKFLLRAQAGFVAVLWRLRQCVSCFKLVMKIEPPPTDLTCSYMYMHTHSLYSSYQNSFSKIFGLLECIIGGQGK